MFILGASIALVLVIIAYYAGRKEVMSSYWKGRGKGWRDCEDMIIARALENGIKDKDGNTMDKEGVWVMLVQ